MNFDAKLKKILAAGDTKQKAITYCFEILEDELDPTDRVAREILNSIPEKERSTFFKWIFYYNVYLYMTTYFGLAFAEYRAEAFKTVKILNRIEQYRYEEQRLNDMIRSVDGEVQKSKLVSVAIEDRHDGTVREEDPPGAIKIEPAQLQKEIYDAIDCVKFTLSGLKGIIEAMEEWGTIRRCKEIQPRAQVQSIAEVKKGYADEIPNFSKTVLRDRERRGETITDKERADAVFPVYDEVESDKNIKAFAAEKLTYYERTIRRDAIWNIALKEVKAAKEKEKKNKK